MYIHIYKSHDVNIFKFQILEIHENEGFKYTKDIRQLETGLDAKERHWIWKLETLTPQGLNVADTFNSQNRSSRKKDLDLPLSFDWYINTYVYIVFFMICPLLISLYNIEALIIICRFESTLLLKYANPCRNLTFQRFARTA